MSAGWLIFGWIFALQADLSHFLGGTFVGVVLVLATVSLVVFCLCCLIMELRDVLRHEPVTGPAQSDGDDNTQLTENSTDAAVPAGPWNNAIDSLESGAPSNPPSQWGPALAEMQDPPGLGNAEEDVTDGSCLVLGGCIEMKGVHLREE